MSLKRSSKRRKQLLEKLFKMQEAECYWCKNKLCKDTRDNDNIKDNTATFDHKVPKSAPHNGSEKESNLVLACYKCNSRRANTISPPQFREKVFTYRKVNQAAEQLIDMYFPVLDKGFIALKDYMGSDECIEDAARTSYGQGTKKKSDTGSLIRYLLRHLHTTPFEMGGELKFHVGLPIFVARQWIRHRTGSFNEYSGRYSEMPMMFYSPKYLSNQSSTNKQGRDNDGKSYGPNDYFLRRMHENRVETMKVYKEMLDAGVSRELARIDLPLSTYTFWYWKTDLKNLLHFVGLRSEFHAQYEIRVYSDIIAGMLQMMYPHTFNAFLDYQFLVNKFTQQEMQMMSKLQHCSEKESNNLLSDCGLNKREIDEFKDKLRIKERPKFTLDTSLAKTPEYFERLINQHSPDKFIVVDKELKWKKE